ncbi:hypothetical protein ACFLVR_03935 [Chloroflexota bacterium]
MENPQSLDPQAIASLICVLAVTLIGIILVILPKTWISVRGKLTLMGAAERSSTVRVHTVFIFFVIVYSIGNAFFGAYKGDAYVIEWFFWFSLVLIIFLFAVAIYSRAKKQPRVPIDEEGFMLLGACSFLVLALGQILFSLLGVASIALDMDIGFYQNENFNLGRWFLYNGLACFIAGFYFLGMKYLGDVASFLKHWK